MEMSVEKTKVMRISRQPTPLQIVTAVAECRILNYLGVAITDAARCRRQIKCGIAVTKVALNRRRLL
jgi:hypothetical protein